MQGRPAGANTSSNVVVRLLRHFGISEENLLYKLKHNMEDFKRDALLYIAFAVMGWAILSTEFSQKLILAGVATVIVVVRSFIKKFLQQ